MPTVKKTDGPRGYIRALDRRVRVGETYDVSRGEAEYVLEERSDFELVEGSLDGDEDDDTDEGDAGEDSDDDGFDVEAFLDRTPVEDVEEDIHAGEVDDHLDAVQEAADRVTVETAVGERRAELEG